MLFQREGAAHVEGLWDVTVTCRCEDSGESALCFCSLIQDTEQDPGCLICSAGSPSINKRKRKKSSESPFSPGGDVMQSSRL